MSSEISHMSFLNTGVSKMFLHFSVFAVLIQPGSYQTVITFSVNFLNFLILRLKAKFFLLVGSFLS